MRWRRWSRRRRPSIVANVPPHLHPPVRPPSHRCHPTGIQPTVPTTPLVQIQHTTIQEAVTSLAESDPEHATQQFLMLTFLAGLQPCARNRSHPTYQTYLLPNWRNPSTAPLCLRLVHRHSLPTSHVLACTRTPLVATRTRVTALLVIRQRCPRNLLLRHSLHPARRIPNPDTSTTAMRIYPRGMRLSPFTRSKPYIPFPRSSPRKLRKPPPDSKQGEALPAPSADHDSNYVYLRHADVPLDPPLQPITSHPLTQTKSASSDSAARTEWRFPLDLTMHELYNGTSQKFSISTADGVQRSVKVVIPPGTLPGARVDALPGVVFEVRERSHAYLMRIKARPYDIFMCCELPWSIDGDIPDGHVVFLGPSGEQLQVALPRGLAEGTEGTRVVGKGMPVQKGHSVVGYGDLYIRCDVCRLWIRAVILNVLSFPAGTSSPRRRPS
jgi:hypothetical protein